MLEDFKNYICKKINNREIMGIFIKTKYIDALLTNYIDKNFINNEKLEYTTIGESKKKNIDMTKDRFKYTDKVLNITIIQILKEDKVSKFIEINDDNKAEEEYKNQDIKYICKSSKGFKVCDGKIKDISEKKFFNYEGDLINEKGSPVILKSNSKLIGLNVDERKALSIKKIINEMVLKLISNNKIKYIECKYKIEKKNIGKNIQIINHGYKGYSSDKMNVLLDLIIEDEDEWKGNFMEIKINEKIKDKFEFQIDQKFYKERKHKFSKEEIYTVKILLDSELDNLSYIFSDCKCLQEVDFSNFNSDKITDMSYMFLNCSSLKKIIFPENFNTEKVKNMNSMFCNCSSLEEIDLTNFNTKNVTDKASMFSGCNKLKNIIVKSKTSIDKNIGEKKINLKSQESSIDNFENSDGIKILDKSKTLNNEKNKNKKNGGKVLRDNFIANTNTEDSILKTKEQNNESQSNKESQKLEKESSLSIFNISKVKNMSCMFAECSSLEGEINLSEFENDNDNDNKKDMSFMFYKCEKLKKIKLSLSSDYEVNMKNMFIGCNCEEYILGNPKIDKNKENIVDIFEDIKYYHFRKFKFTKIECENKELKEIIQIKKWVYICNFILIILLILSIITFIILI